MISDIETLFDRNAEFLSPPVVFLAKVICNNDGWVFIISDGKHHCQAVYEGSDFEILNKVQKVKCKIVLIEFYVKVLNQEEIIAIHVFKIENYEGIPKKLDKKGENPESSIFSLKNVETDNFLPISSLQISSTNWKIRGKIVKKTFIDKASEKTLICKFSDGKTVISAMFLKNLAESYNKRLLKRQIYLISNAALEIKNINNQIKNYNPLMIVITPNSLIKEDFEAWSQANFLSLSQIQNQRPEEIFDTCGIIKKVGQLEKIVSKYQKVYTKRKITLTDESKIELEINLWGKYSWASENIQKDKIIIIKNLIFNKFWVNSIKCFSELLTDYDDPVVDSLKNWVNFNENELNPRNFVKNFINSDEFFFFSLNQAPKSFYFKGKIEKIELKFNQKLTYDACFDPYCKAKVLAESNGEFLCKKCGKVSKTCKIRYFTKLLLSDDFGYIKASAFDEIMTKLLGLEAQDFYCIMNENIEIAQSILDRVSNESYIMKIKQAGDSKVFFKISEIETIENKRNLLLNN